MDRPLTMAFLIARALELEKGFKRSDVFKMIIERSIEYKEKYRNLSPVDIATETVK
jgi:hypothetical protein